MPGKFVWNQEWHQWKEDTNRSTTLEFVKWLSSQLDTCLSEYDAETTYYNEGPRSTYQNQLKKKLLQLFKPALVCALEHIGSTILKEFKHTFQTKLLNRGENFYARATNCIESCLSKFDQTFADVVIEMTNKHKIRVRRKLQFDIVSVVTSSCEEKLKEALTGSIEKELFGEVIIDTWRSIRELLRNEVESTVFRLFTALTGLGIDGDTREKMIESVGDYAKGVVEEKVRGEAKSVLMRMKMCFERRFVNRLFIGKDDIPTAAKSARGYSLELLSILAAIRLNEDDIDDIKEILEAELFVSSSNSAANESSSVEFDPLHIAPDSWEQIPSCRTLIGPRSCKTVWDQFMQETEIIISKALEQVRSSKLSTIYKVVAVGSAATLCLTGGAAGVATAILGPEALLPMLAGMAALFV
ncbi:hypothetical protein S83_065227 [Arachis hypogaea]